MSDEYPQCEALSARAPERAILHNFMNWLEDQKIQFVKELDEGGMSFHAGTNDDLILDYFGIDPEELEKERQALLASL